VALNQNNIGKGFHAMAGPLKPRPLRLRYHAVSIVAGPAACAQAIAVKDVRLLSLEAPRLPIIGCSNPDSCLCKFQHHDDRRAGPRRSGLRTSMRGAGSTNDNRRRSIGRRDSDYADD
jgi:hypothetical protein